MAPLKARFLAKLAENDVDYSTDTVYLFTWNPSNHFYRDTLNEYHIDKWQSMICKVLKHFTRCMSKFCIIPEISDMGRLHCHGWFVIKDKIKWNKSVKPMIARHGFDKYNKLRHVNGYKYYKKELHELDNYLPDQVHVLSHLTMKDDIKDIRTKIINKHLLCANTNTVAEKRSVLDYADLFSMID